MELRIKEICKAKGVLQKDLAAQIGVTDIALRASLKGNPTVNTLEKVADALGVEVTELFSEKGTFTALIDNGGTLHRFDSLESLKTFILTIEK